MKYRLIFCYIYLRSTCPRLLWQKIVFWKWTELPSHSHINFDNALHIDRTIFGIESWYFQETLLSLSWVLARCLCAPLFSFRGCALFYLLKFLRVNYAVSLNLVAINIGSFHRENAQRHRLVRYPPRTHL